MRKLLFVFSIRFKTAISTVFSWPSKNAERCLKKDQRNTLRIFYRDGYKQKTIFAIRSIKLYRFSPYPYIQQMEELMKKFSSNARITELDALSNAVIRIYQANKEVAHDAFLKSVMDEIVGISANLTSAIGQDRILSGLEDADTARDLAVKKLGTALAGYAVLPIEAKKGAAEKLLAIFNKYGKQIAKANYASESSLIESMLEDFGKEGVTACIQELCGIPEMIAEIRTSQDNFVQVNDAYTAKGGLCVRLFYGNYGQSSTKGNLVLSSDS